jgi:GT2 family glycosyltransferase
VDVDLPTSPDRLATTISTSLGDLLGRHMRADGQDAPATLTARGLPALSPAPCDPHLPEPAPLVTVVIATRDRPERLGRCLRAVLDLDYPCLEILVIDSASRDGRTRAVVDAAGERVGYLREARPGLSRARNRGLREAKGTVIAFTDDDMLVDRRWVRALVHALWRWPEAACVTGLYLPGRLETAEEVWFDRHVGGDRGFERRVFDLNGDRSPGPLYPYAPGILGGGGGNIAFRTDVLREIGGFHVGLGAGTPTCGGEDLHIVLSILTAGHQVAYEPAAIIRHHHAVDAGELTRLLGGYGKGLTAMLTARAVERPGEAVEILRRVLPGLRLALGRFATEGGAAAGSGPSRSVIAAELRGMLLGPVAYVRSRRAMGAHERITCP